MSYNPRMGRIKTAVSVRSASLVPVLLEGAASAQLARAIRVVSVVFVATLTAAAAQISFPLPLTPIPFTLQPMIVLLGGAALGGRLGCYSQVLYLAAGIAGLPVFAASPLLPQGALRLLGPSGGYLLSYPLAAWAVGTLADRGFDRKYARSVAAMLAGLAIIYTFGVAWLALVARIPQALGMRGALVAGAWPFLVADVFKIALAAGLLPGVWRLLGRDTRLKA
jgi:biotin transport system substrate-specific component